MTTKMKGLLKGLRYISQIFDNEKEQEMQIGFPTDVKHVAHIGWDGPSVHSPSWMNEYRSPTGFASAPIGPPSSREDHKSQNPPNKLVSEDSSQRERAQEQNGPAAQDTPKSSRRQSSAGSLSGDSPSREAPGKSKHSRRNQSAYASNSPARDLSSSSNRGKPSSRLQDLTIGTDPPTLILPDIPKKSRRKKSKDTSGGGSTRASRSKAPPTATCTAPFSDPGSGSESVTRLKDNEVCPASPSTPGENREAKGCNGISRGIGLV
ncbi:CRIB domain-containing protein RIC7-like [Malania oleifera]|uniref:CRIB domain-containing protein RIC7-like n=1 Tax=Malania oleifera TaxID=397392 RepID=UPI0025AE1555|nr:CRIB domain-containing protein RIC7-like [Malania oleifera]XP_057966057.1 CRIB domain-containing protein RIC7-like [Malania oleifera]